MHGQFGVPTYPETRTHRTPFLTPLVLPSDEILLATDSAAPAQMAGHNKSPSDVPSFTRPTAQRRPGGRAMVQNPFRPSRSFQRCRAAARNTTETALTQWALSDRTPAKLYSFGEFFVGPSEHGLDPLGAISYARVRFAKDSCDELNRLRPCEGLRQPSS